MKWWRRRRREELPTDLCACTAFVTARGQKHQRAGHGPGKFSGRPNAGPCKHQGCGCQAFYPHWQPRL